MASVDTLRLRQNGHHFSDDIFICIFVNGNVLISIKISLKFIPKGPINNIPALLQIMARHRTVDKSLSELVIAYIADACMHHPASMSWYFHILPDCYIIYLVYLDNCKFERVYVTVNLINKIYEQKVIYILHTHMTITLLSLCWWKVDSKYFSVWYQC